MNNYKFALIVTFFVASFYSFSYLFAGLLLMLWEAFQWYKSTLEVKDTNEIVKQEIAEMKNNISRLNMAIGFKNDSKAN